MKIEIIKIDDLICYENNAKIHTDEQINQIVKSIQEFGFNDPIAIDENNMIIEGHGRLYALKKLEHKEVECIRLSHFTEQQKKAYILTHNKLTMNTGYDLNLLEKEMLSISDYNMSDFGFETIDFSQFEEKEEDEEVLETIFNNVEKESGIAKFGDVWQLGKHRLLCGDSTEQAAIVDFLGGENVDLLLTDPPYNVDYNAKEQSMLKYRTNKRVSNDDLVNIDNDKMSDSSFLEFLTAIFTNARECLKEGACFYIFHSSSEILNFVGALNDVGLKMRQYLIWAKNHFSLGRSDYQNKFEPCIYGWKDGAPHNWYGDRKQTTILEFDKPQKNEFHPTMKPVDLLEYLIKNSSKENDVVLDLFGGSGSTLIACEKTNRICYMVEFSPKYVDVIIKRWESLTGETAIKLN